MPHGLGTAEDGTRAQFEFGEVPGTDDAAVFDRSAGVRSVGVCKRCRKLPSKNEVDLPQSSHRFTPGDLPVEKVPQPAVYRDM